MNTESYYDTLGLAPFAEAAMVDQAYWHLAKTYQALVDADPRARQALDDLNAAYAVLGTPRLREEYDASLRPAASSGRWASPRSRTRATEDAAGRKTRFSLPKWPFAKTGSEEAPTEARLRQLAGPVASSRPQQAQPEAPRPVRTTGVQDLHTSTSRMLQRWRESAAEAAKAAEAQEAAPDMTLVDIFKTEQDLEDRDEPLAAVMDILKAPKGTVPTTGDR
jgi:curved DNA-binding protein CbpA